MINIKSKLSRITELSQTIRSTEEGDFRTVLNDDGEEEIISGSITLTDNDSYFDGSSNLFMLISGGNPIPDNFVYQVQYKD